MTRDSIIIGAARAIFTPAAGATTFYSAEGQNIKIPLKPETFEMSPEGVAAVSTRLKDFTPMVDITPEGRWNAAIIAALWPYAQSAKGARIFSGTDRSLVLHTQESHLVTLPSVAVYKMPQIQFSPVKSLLGSVTFAALRQDGVPWSTANSIMTYAASGGTFVDSTYAAASIKTQTYLGNLGSVTGFTNIETFGDEGFTFTPTVELSPIVLTGARTYNYQVRKIGARVSFRPASPTALQIHTQMALQGTGNMPGSELGGAGGVTFTVVGADSITYLSMPNAVIEEGGFAFGSMEPRNDMVSIVAQPVFTAGVLQPLFTLAAA
jgi:hypothetical protein